MYSELSYPTYHQGVSRFLTSEIYTYMKQVRQELLEAHSSRAYHWLLPAVLRRTCVKIAIHRKLSSKLDDRPQITELTSRIPYH
jgi:hypothetical protein